eukprot:171692-Pyramimonas_sp.AAC.1
MRCFLAGRDPLLHTTATTGSGRTHRVMSKCDARPAAVATSERRSTARRNRASGVFPRWTNQTQEVWVYSHDGPSRRRKYGYIPTTDQSGAGRMGIFPQRTNQAQEVWVYSHNGPIRRRSVRVLTA